MAGMWICSYFLTRDRNHRILALEAWVLATGPSGSLKTCLLSKEVIPEMSLKGHGKMSTGKRLDTRDHGMQSAK